MWKLSLRKLEVFLAVADEGGFAAAADRLGISQPSVSHHVAALEKAVGGAAFERRNGRNPLLTDLGRSLLTHAREILGEASDLRADIVRLQRTMGESIVFACQRTLANFALKDAIIRFALDNKDRELVVRIGKQEDVYEEIRGGIADVGCLLASEDLRGMTSEVIGRQRLVLIASPSHRLAGRRHLTPAILSRERFVGAPPGSSFGRAVAKLLAQAGVCDLELAAQATEYPFIRHMVMAEVGISCSPFANVEADVNAGRLCILDFHASDLWIDVRLIRSAARPPKAAVEEFVEYLRQHKFD